MKIITIETDNGYYIQGEKIDNYYQLSQMEGYYFDNKLAEKTFHPQWMRIPKLAKKIHRLERQYNINHRYELIDKTLQSSKFPLIFKQDDVTTADREYGDRIWKEEFKHLSSLYELKSDPQHDKEVIIDDFNFEIILKIDKIVNYGGFSYTVPKTKWESDGTFELTEKNVNYQIIDRIIFPDLVLPSKPCELSSEDSYKIIRQYVKTHINPAYARITSDYDFCFSVEKIITLSENEAYQCNVAGYKAKRPKYETRYRNNRSVKIFEMGHSGHVWQDYTPIKGFSGKNQKELKDNIDNYLNELMEKINKPLVDCPHCKGMGVILQKD